MALSPADIESFITALHEDAALRDRVRGALLSDEFLALPESLRQLDERMANAHAEHVARMNALDERITELDARLTARLDALSERIDRLTERMDALTERMDALTVRMDALTVQMDARFNQMDTRFNRIEGRLGNVEGWQYEARYRDRLTSHLAPRVRKVRLISPVDLDAVFDAYDAGEITDAEWNDLHRLDILAAGSRAGASGEQIFAIEVSITVDRTDVSRAKRRAALLERVGIDTEPAVDGDHILADARALAAELGVTVLVREPADAA